MIGDIMRGFEIAKGYEDYNINLPKRHTKNSAGYDIEIIEDIIIKPNEIHLAKTGLKVYMNNDEALTLYPRSSLSFKHKITIPNSIGLIDSDYYNNDKNDGHIFVALYNFSNEIVKLKKNTRVAQGVFIKYLKTKNDIESDNIRNGGFGSTSDEV